MKIKEYNQRPPIKEILKAQKELMHRFDISEDDTPCCWACWKEVRHNTKVKVGRTKWNTANLERAHMIAASNGGTNQPDNFVLLCKECHAEAPTYGTKEQFISWVLNRESHVSKLSREYNANIVNILNTITTNREEQDAFHEWISKKSQTTVFEGLKRHGIMQKITTHAEKIPLSGYMLACYDLFIIEEKEKQ